MEPDRAARHEAEAGRGRAAAHRDLGQAVGILVPERGAARDVREGAGAGEPPAGDLETGPVREPRGAQSRQRIAVAVEVDDRREVVRPVRMAGRRGLGSGRPVAACQARRRRPRPRARRARRRRRGRRPPGPRRRARTRRRRRRADRPQAAARRPADRRTGRSPAPPAPPAPARP
jgi:hypothetical protein